MSCGAALQPQEEVGAQPSSPWREATMPLVVPREQWGVILATSSRTEPCLSFPAPHQSADGAKHGGNCWLEPNIGDGSKPLQRIRKPW